MRSLGVPRTFELIPTAAFSASEAQRQAVQSTDTLQNLKTIVEVT